MKKVKINLFLFLFFSIILEACSDDYATYNNEPTKNVITRNVKSKEQYMERFAEILSKAVFEEQSVRHFLKEEALKKIDNGYNIFYPIAKDGQINNCSFRDILIKYAKDKEEIENIEANVPLLNIHIPEYGNLLIKDMDDGDFEVPVLLDRTLYYNGVIVDTIAANEIPGFNLFVVCESGSIRKKHAQTRNFSAYPLNENYEFVDQSFDPTYSERTAGVTRASAYEELSEKYKDEGYVPIKDIDPLLVAAYNKSSLKPRATRSLMYYGLNSISETPKEIRPDIKDCIFRFKIAADAFSRLEDIATGQNKPLFYDKVQQKKGSLSREEVLGRILTGRAFCFLFRIEGSVNGNNVISEGMKIYVTPEKLFNLKINEHRRHKTMFRRTKYSYTIDRNGIKSKWFYPLDYGHDTRLNEWNIAKDPINKKVVVYLINPDEGTTAKITETYSLTYISNKGIDGSISAPIIKGITLGINGKLDNTTTTQKTVTTEYSITQSNERIDEFYFDFFNDYPIESVLSNNEYVIPIRKGKGIIETSILPISNSFFTFKRFKR